MEGLRKTVFIYTRVTFRPFEVVQVTNYGTNGTRVCNFLLVRHSNLGPILHRFWDIAGLWCSWLHIYSTLFWECSSWTRSPMLGSVWAGAL